MKAGRSIPCLPRCTPPGAVRADRASIPANWPPDALDRLRIALREPRKPWSARKSPRIPVAHAGGGGSIMRVKSPGGVAGQGHPGNPGLKEKNLCKADY